MKKKKKKKKKRCLQRITKLNKYNWEGIHLPSQKDDWRKFQKNILTIALNVFYDKEKYIFLMF